MWSGSPLYEDWFAPRPFDRKDERWHVQDESRTSLSKRPGVRHRRGHPVFVKVFDTVSFWRSAMNGGNLVEWCFLALKLVLPRSVLSASAQSGDICSYGCRVPRPGHFVDRGAS